MDNLVIAIKNIEGDVKMEGSLKITDGKVSVFLGRLVEKKSKKGNTYYILEPNNNIKIYVWPEDNKQKGGDVNVVKQ